MKLSVCFKEKTRETPKWNPSDHPSSQPSLPSSKNEETYRMYSLDLTLSVCGSMFQPSSASSSPIRAFVKWDLPTPVLPLRSILTDWPPDLMNCSTWYSRLLSPNICSLACFAGLWHLFPVSMISSVKKISSSSGTKNKERQGQCSLSYSYITAWIMSKIGKTRNESLYQN